MSLVTLCVSNLKEIYYNKGTLYLHIMVENEQYKPLVYSLHAFASVTRGVFSYYIYIYNSN